MEKRRRFTLVLILVLASAGWAVYDSWNTANTSQFEPSQVEVEAYKAESAISTLNTLSVKGRAPRTGYSRAQFGGDWPMFGLCDMRNQILRRDFSNVQTVSEEDCTVVSGTLEDPYTGTTINFMRGPGTSRQVEIDHVVALSDAWQKGAQGLSKAERINFANDPLNLLAVSGKANTQKSDSDAASWLPVNKAYRCRYVARQVAVKAKHQLWVTQAEKDAIADILQRCPTQVLPTSGI